MENNNNKWVDSCKLLGTYNDKNVYLYSSCKASAPRIFYSPNYFILPKWIEDPNKMTFFQAVKIIEFRLKNKNSADFRPEDIDIDKLIVEVKNQ